MMDHHASHEEQHATFRLDGIHCTGCADAVEQALEAQPHITSVHVDWPGNAVHVGYHNGMITPAEIERVISSTGCRFEPEEGADHTQHHAADSQPSAARRLDHLKHAVDVQPITMGTKQDRMQYEMPASAGHAHHGASTSDRSAETGAHAMHTAAPSEGHAGMEHAPSAHGAMDHSAHAGMEHGGHGGHAGMDHDMSDPGMAAAMERDMRNKFFIALLLTIPTVLYSPLGMNLLGVNLPTFGLDMNLIMLVLSTPVVFYAGWMFIAGAYHSLRRRTLNMSVLIATGVLAAYVFSVLITFLGGETFFEAAAMLVTFVLFGHWMEMRSRRGTSDALRALFDLVPPQATVIRDGIEETIPSSDLQVDDVVLLRPGDKVAVNAVLLKRVERDLQDPSTDAPAAPLRPEPA